MALSKSEKSEQLRLAGKNNRSYAETYRLRQLIEKERVKVTATRDRRARSSAGVSSIRESGDREGRVGLARAQSISGTQAASGGGLDVRKIQQRLRDAGYPIAVDGVWGPKSAAAWTDYTARGGSMTSDPAQGAGGTPASAGGGGAVATGLDAAGTESPAAPPTDADVLDEYPQLAAFLKIPVVGDLLRQAKSEGWPPEKLQARLQQTDWWKTTPPAARAFMGLEATDPAAAAQKIAEQKDEILKANRAYGIAMSDEAVGMYSRQVASGGSDMAAYQKMLVEQAKGKFPALAAAFDQGLTFRQIADPFVEQAAKELEISSDSIDLTDPKWLRPLQGFDEGGKPRAMTLYEWQRTLRTDAVYGYDRTSGARRTASELASAIGQTFGRIG